MGTKELDRRANRPDASALVGGLAVLVLALALDTVHGILVRLILGSVAVLLVIAALHRILRLAVEAGSAFESEDSAGSRSKASTPAPRSEIPADSSGSEPEPRGGGVDTQEAYENFVVFTPDGRDIPFERDFAVLYPAVEAVTGS